MWPQTEVTSPVAQGSTLSPHTYLVIYLLNTLLLTCEQVITLYWVRIKSAPILCHCLTISTLLLTCEDSSIAHSVVFSSALHASFLGMVSKKEPLFRDPIPSSNSPTNPLVSPNALYNISLFFCNSSPNAHYTRLLCY